MVSIKFAMVMVSSALMTLEISFINNGLVASFIINRQRSIIINGHGKHDNHNNYGRWGKRITKESQLFLLNNIREQVERQEDGRDKNVKKSNNNANNSNNRVVSGLVDLASETETVEESDAHESKLVDYWNENKKYRSPLLLLDQHQEESLSLWNIVQMEAREMLEREMTATHSVTILATHVLSHDSLYKALTTLVSTEMETDFIPATALVSLFRELFLEEDMQALERDVIAAAMRSPKSSPDSASALNAVLFHPGLHALVAHRLAHRLWKAGRRGLAMYIQSTSSQTYSTDIHPAATLGHGIYLNSVGPGVVIGETAVVQNDCTILQGVTLGGTGKEAGDRHPKIGQGVVLMDSSSVLGNIQIGDGAVITAKSIVNKPVPPLARVSGIPAKVKSYRQIITTSTTNTNNSTTSAT